MIKLNKGDAVLWYDRKTGGRHRLRVTQTDLKNKRGVPQEFMAEGVIPGPRKSKKVRKRLSQFDQEQVLLLAPAKEWATFFRRGLPLDVVVARLPGHAQPTYGLFDTNVVNVAWRPLEGVVRTESRVPLEFWRHGDNPADMDWCLNHVEVASAFEWRHPIPDWMREDLQGVEIHG